MIIKQKLKKGYERTYITFPFYIHKKNKYTKYL